MPKTLAELWEHFEAEVLITASPQMRGFAHATFYAGASACFALSNLFAHGLVSEDEAVKILLEMQREIDGHKRQIVEIAKQGGSWSQVQ